MRARDEAKMILGFCPVHLGEWLSRFLRDRPGVEQIEGGRRMENLCRPWVQLSHMYSCHASGDAEGLEVKVKAQAGDKTWESLAELGWMTSLREEKMARVGPTLGAQEEQLRE